MCLEFILTIYLLSSKLSNLINIIWLIKLSFLLLIECYNNIISFVQTYIINNEVYMNLFWLENYNNLLIYVHDI